MNLLGKKTFGLAVFSTLLALFMSSCTEETPIGTELDPNKNNVGVALVEIPVYYDNLKIDSLLSSDYRLNSSSSTLSQILLGKRSDPNSGEITLTTYITFGISSGNTLLVPARDSVATSLELGLTIIDVAGDVSGDQVFDIYPLFQKADSTTNYFTSDFVGLLPGLEPLGSFTISELDTVDFEANEVQSVRTDLSDTLKNMFFQYAADGDLFTSRTFQNVFPGLMIKPRETNTALINIDRSNIGLRLNYYRLDDEEENGQVVSTDTVELAVEFAAGKAYFNADIDPIGPFQGITGTELVETGDQVAYLSPQLGVFPKLDLSGLSAFRDTISNDNISVNFAQIILGGVEEEATTPLPANLTLAVTRPDLDFVSSTTQTFGIQSTVPLSVADETAVILSGTSPLAYTTLSANRLVYSEEDNAYVGDITSLVQQLLNQDSVKVAFSKVTSVGNEIDSVTVGNDDYLLMPLSGFYGGYKEVGDTIVATGVYPIFNTVRNVRFDGNRLKLKVYYTTID